MIELNENVEILSREESSITIPATIQITVKTVVRMIIDGVARDVVVNHFNPSDEDAISIGINNRYENERLNLE